MNNFVKDSLTGGLTALASTSDNPIISVTVATGAPIIVSLTTDFLSRILSSLQSLRLLRGLHSIDKKINNKLFQGKKVRHDGDMSVVNGNQAKQVLEGIIQNITDEYEEKKMEVHTNFFTNLCFDERIVFEQALYLTRVLKQLSYRQLVLIAISHDKPLEAGGWQFKFKDSGNQNLEKFADLYSEIQNLEQMRIIEDSNRGVTLGGSSAPLRLSLWGNIIYEEVGLASMPEDDKQIVLQMISSVNNG